MKPVSLVLTPLRDARVEVALTCSDEVKIQQPDFGIQQKVSAVCVPDASAESTVSQPETASSLSAASQQAAEITPSTASSTNDCCDTIVKLQPALSVAAVPAVAAKINSQQAKLAIPSGLQVDQALSAVKKVSSSPSAQDPQEVLQQVATESPRVHVRTAGMETPALSKPEVLDNKPVVSAQEPYMSAKSEQTSVAPTIEAGKQMQQAAVHRSILPSCSKRHAEVSRTDDFCGQDVLLPSFTLLLAMHALQFVYRTLLFIEMLQSCKPNAIAEYSICSGTTGLSAILQDA